MDPSERDRIDRINREAELERTPGDPQPAGPKDAKPLILMICLAMVAAAVVLGVMWVSNTRYDGAGPQPVAEQPRR